MSNVAAFNEVLELPQAIALDIESLHRIIAHAAPEILPEILREGAADLFRLRKVSKTVHPEADAVVNIAIADALHEIASVANLDPDHAQHIFEQARADSESEPKPRTALPPSANHLEGHRGAAFEPPNGSAGPPRRRFQLEMLDQIAITDDPVELVHGLLPIGPALGVVFGPPKSLKSFLLTHVFLHIADNRPFYGRAVQGGAVVYVTSEGIRGVRRRLIAARRAMGIEGQNAPFALVSTMPNLGTGSDDREALRKLIVGALEPLGVPLRAIGIDTMRRAMPGKSENEQKDVSVLVDNCEALARAFDCLVMLAHHSPRSDEQRGSGSNALDGAADVMWSVTRPDESRRSATATVVRHKDGEEGDAWTFELRPSEIGVDRNGSPITSCSVEVTIEPERKSAVTKTLPLSPAQQRVFDILVTATAEAGESGLAGNAAPAGTRAVARNMLKRYAIAAGWWEEEDDKSSRTRFSARLNELAGKHAIGLTAEHAWPVCRSFPS